MMVSPVLWKLLPPSTKVRNDVILTKIRNLTSLVVYGMGTDLALILGVMGTVWTGNPLSLNPGFSIGGPGADNLLGNVLGLVGKYSPYCLQVHAHTDGLLRRPSWTPGLSQLDRV
jgi:hypothetical protein